MQISNTDNCSRLSYAFEIVVSLAVLSFFVVNVLILTLFNGPDNAIKINARSFLHAYVGTFIDQDWSFFAPRPVDRNYDVLVRGRTRRNIWTPWTNMSGYLNNQIQANRLSNFDLIGTGVHNATLDAASLNAPRLRKRGVNLYQYRSVAFLARAGFSFLRSEYPTERLRKIQVGILVAIFPRFTKRFEKTSLRHTYFINYGTEIAPTGVVGFPW